MNNNNNDNNNNNNNNTTKHNTINRDTGCADMEQDMMSQKRQENTAGSLRPDGNSNDNNHIHLKKKQ